MSTPKKPRTVEVTSALALPVAEQMGLTLWDTRFEKEGGGWYLRYFIDKPGGVNIQDCETFSRAVDKLLDAADPIDQSYTLEVSSPGVPRSLTRAEHFELYLGAKITVRLIRPRDGVREISGSLQDRSPDGEVTISPQTGGEDIKIPKADIATVKLAVDI